MISYEIFKENCVCLRGSIEEICKSCGRDPKSVSILPVTKTHPIEAVLFAERYGFVTVGENRVQEAITKISNNDISVRWELIGHLQSNKAKVAASNFDRIQSVDNAKLAGKLDFASREQGKTLAVLLQVNAGNDSAKYGVSCEEAAKLLETALGMQNLRVEGLMTIAPLSEDKSVAATTFNRLSELRDNLVEEFDIELPELSMGMSGDMEEAIKAGSTMIRVGTALFGVR